MTTPCQGTHRAIFSHRKALCPLLRSALSFLVAAAFLIASSVPVWALRQVGLEEASPEARQQFLDRLRVANEGNLPGGVWQPVKGVGLEEGPVLALRKGRRVSLVVGDSDIELNTAFVPREGKSDRRHAFGPVVTFSDPALGAVILMLSTLNGIQARHHKDAGELMTFIDERVRSLRGQRNKWDSGPSAFPGRIYYGQKFFIFPENEALDFIQETDADQMSIPLIEQKAPVTVTVLERIGDQTLEGYRGFYFQVTGKAVNGRPVTAHVNGVPVSIKAVYDLSAGTATDTISLKVPAGLEEGPVPGGLPIDKVVTLLTKREGTLYLPPARGSPDLNKVFPPQRTMLPYNGSSKQPLKNAIHHLFEQTPKEDRLVHVFRDPVPLAWASDFLLHRVAKMAGQTDVQGKGMKLKVVALFAKKEGGYLLFEAGTPSVPLRPVAPSQQRSARESPPPSHLGVWDPAEPENAVWVTLQSLPLASTGSSTGVKLQVRSPDNFLVYRQQEWQEIVEEVEAAGGFWTAGGQNILRTARNGTSRKEVSLDYGEQLVIFNTASEEDPAQWQEVAVLQALESRGAYYPDAVIRVSTFSHLRVDDPALAQQMKERHQVSSLHIPGDDLAGLEEDQTAEPDPPWVLEPSEEETLAAYFERLTEWAITLDLPPDQIGFQVQPQRHDSGHPRVVINRKILDSEAISLVPALLARLIQQGNVPNLGDRATRWIAMVDLVRDEQKREWEVIITRTSPLRPAAGLEEVRAVLGGLPRQEEGAMHVIDPALMEQYSGLEELAALEASTVIGDPDVFTTALNLIAQGVYRIFVYGNPQWIAGLEEAAKAALIEVVDEYRPGEAPFQRFLQRLLANLSGLEEETVAERVDLKRFAHLLRQGA